MTSKSPLTGILQRAESTMWTEFEDAGAFGNGGDTGEAREQGLVKFLEDRLPDRYHVARGEVVDVAGEQSGQTDILIYDGSTAAPLLSGKNGLVLLPVEAVLASIEVKSSLSSDELRKSALGIGKLRSLRPYGSPWGLARRNGTPADDGLPTFFSTVFAYKSSIQKDWETAELDRVRRVCKEVAVPTQWIDRVLVLTKGVVLPSTGMVAKFPSGQQVLGLWYFHLMNFLARESARREPFPWSMYERGLTPDWIKAGLPLEDAPKPKRASKRQRRSYANRAR